MYNQAAKLIREIRHTGVTEPIYLTSCVCTAEYMQSQGCWHTCIPNMFKNYTFVHQPGVAFWLEIDSEFVEVHIDVGSCGIMFAYRMTSRIFVGSALMKDTPVTLRLEK